MKVLNSDLKYSETIQKSKFICFGFFVQSKDKVQEIIASVKKQYPDASHICYAYILDDKTFYYSDGGEPSGTAGKPMLEALLSIKLNYTLVIIVRYFGGIKFGVGPLRHTFKDMVLSTIKKEYIKDATLTDIVSIEVEYSQISTVHKMFTKSIYHEQYKKDKVIIILIGSHIEILNKLERLHITPLDVKKNQLV